MMNSLVYFVWIFLQLILCDAGSPSSDSTTLDTDILGIVGSIIGDVLVIINAGVVLFFIKRRLRKLKSQDEHQYDSASNRIIDQPTSVDDTLNTRLQTDERAQYINEQQLSTTTNGQSQGNYITHDYEHAYDPAPSVATDQPKAVYDSLNTREQTGYYNMGSINIIDEMTQNQT